MIFKRKDKNDKAELLRINPKSFVDTKEMARQLKKGNVIIVNFEHLNNSEILRIIDFVSGVLFILDGKYKKISNKTYLLSPSQELLSEFSNQV